jgi:putative transposase
MNGLARHRLCGIEACAGDGAGTWPHAYPSVLHAYEAGGCGYGLHRQLTRLGHDCVVVAQSQDAGAKTQEVCRRHGISDATFYKWKAKYGWLDVSEARRLKSLEDKNRRLKKLLAEAMLDNAVLKDLLEKNG